MAAKERKECKKEGCKEMSKFQTTWEVVFALFVTFCG